MHQIIDLLTEQGGEVVCRCWSSVNAAGKMSRYKSYPGANCVDSFKNKKQKLEWRESSRQNGLVHFQTDVHQPFVFQNAGLGLLSSLTLDSVF